MPEINKIIATAKGWALTSDGVQWMLARSYLSSGRQYYATVSFVRSERDVLLRCMRERGLRPAIIKALTRNLPETFDIWKQNAAGLTKPVVGAPVPVPDIELPPPDKRAPLRRKWPPLPSRRRE